MAAFLLGKFRAVEAVPVLSQALVDEPGPKVTLRIDGYAAPVTSHGSDRLVLRYS